MTARFIDIHLLQTVPFSNLNRDDLGSPKTLTYGGTQRTRVSSQCWKRATREHMEAVLAERPGYDRAIRTRMPVEILTRHLANLGWAQEETTNAARVVFGPYLEDQKETGDADESVAARGNESNVLLFLTDSQYADLATIATDNRELVLAAKPTKKEKDEKPEFKKHVRAALNEVIKSSRGLISVFGRMIAQLPTANVDAGVQVAHAFTVHESAPEFDYFTAVDDYTRDENSGAGHLASAEFVTGTFYRYATVDIRDLSKNVGDDALARELAEQFLLSFAQSLPSGKSHSTAANTLPSLVVVEVREDRPQSYAVAFEQPVGRGPGGYLHPSLTQLAEHASLLATAYGQPPTWSGHINAVSAAPDVVSTLTGAFGAPAQGGLLTLISQALDHSALMTSGSPA